MKDFKIIVTCEEQTYDRFYYIRKMMRKKMKVKLTNEEFINLLLDGIESKAIVKSY